MGGELRDVIVRAVIVGVGVFLTAFGVEHALDAEGSLTDAAVAGIDALAAAGLVVATAKVGHHDDGPGQHSPGSHDGPGAA